MRAILSMEKESKNIFIEFYSNKSCYKQPTLHKKMDFRNNFVQNNFHAAPETQPPFSFIDNLAFPCSQCSQLCFSSLQLIEHKKKDHGPTKKNETKKYPYLKATINKNKDKKRIEPEEMQNKDSHLLNLIEPDEIIADMLSINSANPTGKSTEEPNSPAQIEIEFQQWTEQMASFKKQKTE